MTHFDLPNYRNIKGTSKRQVFYCEFSKLRLTNLENTFGKNLEQSNKIKSKAYVMLTKRMGIKKKISMITWILLQLMKG